MTDSGAYFVTCIRCQTRKAPRNLDRHHGICDECWRNLSEPPREIPARRGVHLAPVAPVNGHRRP